VKRIPPGENKKPKYFLLKKGTALKAC